MDEILRDAFPDLRGDVRVQVATDHSDYWTGAPVSTVLLAEHRLSPVVKHAAWMRVSNEMLDDAEALRNAMARAFDRHLRPASPTVAIRRRADLADVRPVPAHVRTRLPVASVEEPSRVGARRHARRPRRLGPG